MCSGEALVACCEPELMYWYWLMALMEMNAEPLHFFVRLAGIELVKSHMLMVAQTTDTTYYTTTATT